ncbi:YibE/F family protein [uncultured Limosilactobacillus sp.]|uniref:YibE/F family protein n=1 Tax=uncultured Limosilactobacillus sp. TaxID=2837629 RepID=UPI0025FB257C|nr:YibE/F family protein [uncultured Limosilactobacillus sp.]
MSTISLLTVVLLALMVIVGGRQGWSAFWSLLLNFCCLFFAIVLVSWGLSPLWITLLAGILILAQTIWLGVSDGFIAKQAFWSSLIVFIVLFALVTFVEYVAKVPGFGVEDTDALEGMSLSIGVSYPQIAVMVAALCSLGAIAEAAISVAAGMATLLDDGKLTAGQSLFHAGMQIGRQIIGTALNTLFFGFFGGFLALFIWFAGLGYSFLTVINDKVFVNEIIIVLVSFVGVLLTVPVTAWLVSGHQRPSQ